MPSFGDYTKEITTVKDLKELLHELVDIHMMDDNAKIKFRSRPFDPEVKVMLSGDISYAEDEVGIVSVKLSEEMKDLEDEACAKLKEYVDRHWDDIAEKIGGWF